MSDPPQIRPFAAFLQEQAQGHLHDELSVALKTPAADRRNGVFFVTVDNNLSRDNPSQPEIPGLRGIPGGAADAAHFDQAGESK